MVRHLDKLERYYRCNLLIIRRKVGASEEIRTLDIFVGNEMLYH